MQKRTSVAAFLLFVLGCGGNATRWDDYDRDAEQDDGSSVVAEIYSQQALTYLDEGRLPATTEELRDSYGLFGGPGSLSLLTLAHNECKLRLTTSTIPSDLLTDTTLPYSWCAPYSAGTAATDAAVYCSLKLEICVTNVLMEIASAPGDVKLLSSFNGTPSTSTAVYSTIPPQNATSRAGIAEFAALYQADTLINQTTPYVSNVNQINTCSTACTTSFSDGGVTTTLASGIPRLIQAYFDVLVEANDAAINRIVDLADAQLGNNPDRTAALKAATRIRAWAAALALGRSTGDTSASPHVTSNVDLSPPPIGGSRGIDLAWALLRESALSPTDVASNPSHPLRTQPSMPLDDAAFLDVLRTRIALLRGISPGGSSTEFFASIGVSIDDVKTARWQFTTQQERYKLSIAQLLPPIQPPRTAASSAPDGGAPALLTAVYAAMRFPPMENYPEGAFSFRIDRRPNNGGLPKLGERLVTLSNVFDTTTNTNAAVLAFQAAIRAPNGLSAVARAYSTASIDHVVNPTGNAVPFSTSVFVEGVTENGAVLVVNSSSIRSSMDVLSCAETGKIASIPCSASVLTPYGAFHDTTAGARRFGRDLYSWPLAANPGVGVPAGSVFVLVRRAEFRGGASPSTLVPGTYELIHASLLPGQTGSIQTIFHQSVPRLERKAGEILRPSAIGAQAARSCAALDGNDPLVLESTATDNGDGVENSWRRYLDLAHQAAIEADTLGEAALTQRAAAAQQAEASLQELQQLCGVTVDVQTIIAAMGTTTRDAVAALELPAIVASTDPNIQRLRACVSASSPGTTPATVIPHVTLGTRPLCAWYLGGDPNAICQLAPADVNGTNGALACPSFALAGATSCPMPTGSGTYTKIYLDQSTGGLLGYFNPDAESTEQTEIPTSSCKSVREFFDQLDLYARGSIDEATFKAQPSYGWMGTAGFLRSERVQQLGRTIRWEAIAGGFSQLYVNELPRVGTGTLAIGPGLSGTCSTPGAECPTAPGGATPDRSLLCLPSSDPSCPPASVPDSSSVAQAAARLNERTFAAAIVARWLGQGRIDGFKVAHPDGQTKMSNDGRATTFAYDTNYVRSFSTARNDRRFCTERVDDSTPMAPLWAYSFGTPHFQPCEGSGHQNFLVRTILDSYPFFSRYSNRNTSNFASNNGITADQALRAMVDGSFWTNPRHRPAAGPIASFELLDYMPSGMSPKRFWWTDLDRSDSSRREFWCPSGGTAMPPSAEPFCTMRRQPSGASECCYGYDVPLPTLESQWGALVSGSETSIRRQVLEDGLELLCEADRMQFSSGTIAVGCGEQTTDVSGTSDLSGATTQSDCISRALRARAGKMIFANLPASAVDAMRNMSPLGASTSVSGDYLEAVTQLRTSLVQVGGIASDITHVADSLKRTVSLTELKLKALGLQENLQRNRMMAEVFNQFATCARVSAELGSAATVVAPGKMAAAVIVCANSMAQIQLAMARYTTQVQLNGNQEEQALNVLSQAAADASQALRNAGERINVYAEQMDSSLARIATTRAKAQQAFRTAMYLSGAPTDPGQASQSTVRARMNTANVRYQRAFEYAKRLAYLAKRAIEYRYAVRLTDLVNDLKFVSAPATWESRLCSMSGIDYARLQREGADVHGDYADQYIGDYVDNLEKFVLSYGFEYPYNEGSSTAVISIRDDVAHVTAPCEVSVSNLLGATNDYTTDADAAALPSNVANGAWMPSGCDDAVVADAALTTIDCTAVEGIRRTCTLDANCGTGACVNGLCADDGLPTSETGPFGRPEPFRVRFGNLSDARCYPTRTATCPCDDNTCSWKAAVSGNPGSRQSQRVALAEGTFRLSWYARPVASTGTTATDAAEALAVLGRDGREIDRGNEIGSPISFAGSTWKRYGLTFALGAPELVEVTILNNRDVQGAAIDVAGVMLEAVPLGASATPGRFVATTTPGRGQLAVCEDSDGDVFRASSWRRVCETCTRGICPEGSQRCYWETSFDVTDQQLESGAIFQGSGFATGNFNYRLDTIAVNFVGSASRECTDPVSSSVCYGSGFIPYTLEHVGPFTVRAYDDTLYGASLEPGRIRGALGLAAARYISNPISSADASLLGQFTRRELTGRTLTGTYRLRVHDAPGVHFEGIEDVQLVVGYEYWTQSGVH